MTADIGRGMKLTPQEELELLAHVGTAWDARDYPNALSAACSEIADWYDALAFRRAQRVLWQQEARIDRLAALMREEVAA